MQAFISPSPWQLPPHAAASSTARYFPRCRRAPAPTAPFLWDPGRAAAAAAASPQRWGRPGGAPPPKAPAHSRPPFHSPTRPWPWLTCPLSFRVFLSLEGCGEEGEQPWARRAARATRTPLPPRGPRGRAPWRTGLPAPLPPAADSEPRFPTTLRYFASHRGSEGRRPWGPNPIPSPPGSDAAPTILPACARERKGAALARAGKGAGGGAEISRGFAEAGAAGGALRGGAGPPLPTAGDRSLTFPATEEQRFDENLGKFASLVTLLNIHNSGKMNTTSVNTIIYHTGMWIPGELLFLKLGF